MDAHEAIEQLNNSIKQLQQGKKFNSDTTAELNGLLTAFRYAFSEVERTHTSATAEAATTALQTLSDVLIEKLRLIGITEPKKINQLLGFMRDDLNRKMGTHEEPLVVRERLAVAAAAKREADRAVGAAAAKREADREAAAAQRARQAAAAERKTRKAVVVAGKRAARAAEELGHLPQMEREKRAELADNALRRLSEMFDAARHKPVTPPPRAAAASAVSHSDTAGVPPPPPAAPVPHTPRRAVGAGANPNPHDRDAVETLRQALTSGGSTPPPPVDSSLFEKGPVYEHVEVMRNCDLIARFFGAAAELYGYKNNILNDTCDQLSQKVRPAMMGAILSGVPVEMKIITFLKNLQLEILPEIANWGQVQEHLGGQIVGVATALTNFSRYLATFVQAE